MSLDKKYSKTVSSGGGGKCRVFYSEKFKRYVVEKIVDDKFLRLKKDNITLMKAMMTKYTNNENYLRKTKIFMLLTKVAK